MAALTCAGVVGRGRQFHPSGVPLWTQESHCPSFRLDSPSRSSDLFRLFFSLSARQPRSLDGFWRDFSPSPYVIAERCQANICVHVCACLRGTAQRRPALAVCFASWSPHCKPSHPLPALEAGHSLPQPYSPKPACTLNRKVFTSGREPGSSATGSPVRCLIPASLFKNTAEIPTAHNISPSPDLRDVLLQLFGLVGNLLFTKHKKDHGHPLLAFTALASFLHIFASHGSLSSPAWLPCLSPSYIRLQHGRGYRAVA